MNIHEYQAKAILRNFGVPVPEGHVVYNGNSARDWAKRLGDGPYAVKAQIHAGGRGKGGGVKIAKTADEAKKYARAMFGMTLVTHQSESGPTAGACVCGDRATKNSTSSWPRSNSQSKWNRCA